MKDRPLRLRLYEIQVSHRTVWRLVEAETDDGFKGTAECSDTRQGASARRYLEALVAQLGDLGVGDSPAALDNRLPAPPQGTSADDRFDHRMVTGAVITALCDIWAKRSGVPLGVMLGGNPTAEVPLYANINRAPRERTADEFVAVARRAVEAGFRRIKLAPFDAPTPGASSLLGSGLDVLRAVHHEVGSEATLLVDVHHRLHRDDLEVAVRTMEDLEVGWIEDAVDVNRPDELEWLAGFTELPLAGGERLTSPEDFARISGYGFLTYVLIDPKYVGSPFRYMTILEALSDDVTVTHHNPTSPVSTALCAQLAMLSQSIGPLEYAFGEPVDRSTTTDPAEELAGDTLLVSSGPGIGVELKDPLESLSPEDVEVSSWMIGASS